MPSPDITLIVPVYNGRRYLRELLDSVLCQSFKNWICVCVNDGSTDSSAAMISGYAERDSRVKLISKANTGTGDSRNAGLQHAQSKYVMFADQDDVLHPQCFEIAYSCIESSQVDVLTYGRTNFSKRYCPRPIPLNDAHVELLSGEPIDQFLAIERGVSICVWQRIYRMATLQGVLFPKITGGEDQVFMMEIALRAPKWAMINVSLYGARENQSSVSRSVPLWYIENVFQAYDEIVKLPGKYPVDRNRISAFIANSVFLFSLSIVLRCGGKSDATLAFSKLASLIQKAEEAGVFHVKMLRGKTLLFDMLKKRRFFLLRCFAFMFGFLVSLQKLHRPFYRLLPRTNS